jgi:nucleotide-binding universal stress UspA family protein
MTKPSTAAPDESAKSTETGPVFADVLCAVDGTRGSFAAVEQAAALAGPSGQLTVLTVTALGGAGAFKHAAVSPARAEGLLEYAAAIAEATGVSTSKVIDHGSPAAQTILDRAADKDLLAIGAPVTSWLGGLFIGGVAVEAMGSFSTPLLAARPATRAQDLASRILVASDGLEGCDAAVELAGRLARSSNASVVLLHASGVESNAGHLGIEAHERSLKRAVGDAVETLIVAERAWKAIVEAAESTAASIVVMGSRRLDGLHAIGSVSRRVVHQAPCSVVLTTPRQPKRSRST